MNNWTTYRSMTAWFPTRPVESISARYFANAAGSIPVNRQVIARLDTQLRSQPGIKLQHILRAAITGIDRAAFSAARAGVLGHADQ